jgi:hypothetical protein
MIVVLLLALIPLWVAHPGPTAADLLGGIVLGMLLS